MALPSNIDLTNPGTDIGPTGPVKNIDLTAGVQSAWAPTSAPVQPQLTVDTSKAVKDGDKVWVKIGGQLGTIPEANLAGVASRQKDVEFASPQEVQAQKDVELARENGTAGAWKSAVQQFGTSLANVVSGAGRAIATGAGLYMGSIPGGEDYQKALFKFAQESGGESLAKDLAYLTGGVEGENEFVRGYTAREKAFPVASGFGRAAGLVVPTIATAGLAGLATGGAAAAESTLGSLASTLFSPSGVANIALSGALQGAASGMVAPFETMDNTPISREAVLASGGMGALFGAATGGLIGVGTKYAPGLLSKVFGKGVSAEERAAAQAEIHASLPDAIRTMGESDDAAQKALYKTVVDKGSLAGAKATALADRIEAAAKAAGPNPELQKAAAQEAVERELQRLNGEVKPITPEMWKDKSLTPDDMVFHRDTLKEGAKQAITKDLSDVVQESKQVMEQLRNYELKTPLIRKNLKDMTAEESEAAFIRSRETVDELKSTFQDLMEHEGFGSVSAKTKTAKSLEHSFERAGMDLANAEDAAEAYIAIDRLRRDIDKRIPSIQKQVMSTAADEAYEGQVLSKYVEGGYEKLRSFLADSSTWGQQGKIQMRVNQAWADDIAAEGRVSKLGNFMSQDVKDRYGRMTMRVDPDKIERYLDGLGSKTIPDRDLSALVQSKINLLKEVGESYGVSSAQLKRAVESTTSLKDSIESAHRVMTEAGGAATWWTNVLSSRAARLTGNAVGGAAGAVLGHAVGGPVGGIVTGMVGSSIGAAVEEYAATKIPALINALAKRDLNFGFGKLPQVYQKALARNILAGVPAGSRFLFESTKGKTKEERVDAFNKRSEMLAKLSTNQPALMKAGQAALGRFNQVQPGMAEATTLDAQQKLANLMSVWPGKSDRPSVVKNKALSSPSEQDITTAENLFLATTNPLSVFDSFKSGNVDPQAVAMVWQQHPELQKMFQSFTVDALQQLGENETLASNVLSQLDFFLGFNGTLDESLDRGLSGRMDEIGKQSAQQQPKGGGQLNLPTSEPTYSQRLAGASGKA